MCGGVSHGSAVIDKRIEVFNSRGQRAHEHAQLRGISTARTVNRADALHNTCWDSSDRCGDGRNVGPTLRAAPSITTTSGAAIAPITNVHALHDSDSIARVEK